MSITHAEFQSRRLFGALDGLRALSVIAVIWHHTSGKPGPIFFSKGDFGVDFFFAISGFLITTLLLRERRKNRRFSIRKFYIRRIFRIFPIYYLVLTLYVLLVVLTRRETQEGQSFLSNLPAFLTYTSNWFVGLSEGNRVTFYFAWSLATEEQFYLFWPPLLALLLLIPAKVPWPVLTGIGVLVAVSQMAILSGETALPVVILGSLALPILLGAAAAIIFDNRSCFEVFSPVVGARWFSPIVVLLMFISLAFETPEQITQVLMVLVVLSVCITERTLFHGFLTARLLAYVGVISYGIYLMHMLCANTVRFLFTEDYGIHIFALTSLLTIAVAAVSFRIIESPILRFGRRFGSNAHTDAAARLGKITDPLASPRRVTEAQEFLNLRFDVDEKSLED